MKSIYLFIILAFITNTALAQWYGGGAASVTFSNYKSKTPWKEVANTGFAFGFTAYKQINSEWGFQANIEYIQKGYFHKICNTIYDKLEATYIELPVMADYSFLLPLKNFKGHLNVGVYSAYWLTAKYKTKGFDNESENLNFNKTGTSRFDAGPLVGTRIEYLLNNANISLNLRYELGLLDLQNSANDNTRNNNRAFIVGLSYIKPFGH